MDRTLLTAIYIDYNGTADFLCTYGYPHGENKEKTLGQKGAKESRNLFRKLSCWRSFLFPDGFSASPAVVTSHREIWSSLLQHSSQVLINFTEIYLHGQIDFPLGFMGMEWELQP